VSKFVRIVAAYGALPVLLLLSACTASRHTSDERYYLVASNIKIPYWQAAAAGLNRAASLFNVQAILSGPDTYDRQAQLAELRRVIALKPAGIMVSAADSDLLKDDIDRGIAAGIPIITVDSDAPASKRLLFIGTNNYQAGITGGRVLAKQLHGKGKVVVLTIPGQSNLAERLRGYRDALAESPQIEIAQVVDIHGDPAAAFDQTMQIVKSGKLNVDAFVCLEATAGKEVGEVLSRNKIQGKIVIAMDTDEGTLDWIDKEVIVATLGQKPFTMAYYGLKVLDDLHHYKLNDLGRNWMQNLQSPIPANIDTGAILIDRSNLKEMRSTKVAGLRSFESSL
jgi:ribose transport system substrate-binding protein